MDKCSTVYLLLSGRGECVCTLISQPFKSNSNTKMRSKYHNSKLDAQCLVASFEHMQNTKCEIWNVPNLHPHNNEVDFDGYYSVCSISRLNDFQCLFLTFRNRKKKRNNFIPCHFQEIITAFLYRQNTMNKNKMLNCTTCTWNCVVPLKTDTRLWWAIYCSSRPFIFIIQRNLN